MTVVVLNLIPSSMSSHIFMYASLDCLVCDPFDGIVFTNLALYLKHLISKEKEFTYTELNMRINQFKYLINDANNKPHEVNPGAGKLSEHAVQNWCFQ